MIIEIIGVPDGPAPMEIKRAWVGVILVAIPTPEDFVEYDCISLAKLAEEIKDKMVNTQEVSRAEYESFIEKNAAAHMENRGGCMVPVEVALIMLERQKSAKSADWFRVNWPNKKGWFLFGPDEYRILQNPKLN